MWIRSGLNGSMSLPGLSDCSLNALYPGARREWTAYVGRKAWRLAQDTIGKHEQWGRTLADSAGPADLSLRSRRGLADLSLCVRVINWRTKRAFVRWDCTGGTVSLHAWSATFCAMPERGERNSRRLSRNSGAGYSF